jgi:hypothetical protein
LGARQCRASFLKRYPQDFLVANSLKRKYFDALIHNFCGYLFRSAVFVLFTFVRKFDLMRGQKTFKDILKEPGLGAPIVKGRNNKLILRRNDCLLARYYYYGFFRNMLYEEIIRQLVAEFYISPNTIANIIQSHAEDLQALKHRAQVLHYFQNHWPHLKW